MKTVCLLHCETYLVLNGSRDLIVISTNRNDNIFFPFFLNKKFATYLLF